MTLRHTLLVVDDEPDVLRSVQDLLRLHYTVLTASSATEGLRLMGTNDVHVVITDHRMPGMTGVEMLREARRRHPDVMRLLLTGYADIRAVVDAINAGEVYRYVTKPWDAEELQTVIREACERYTLLMERKSLLADLQAKNALLEAKNAELLEANELKNAFIQVASHELRTPLTILVGLTDLVVRAPGLDEGMRNKVARIKAASDRLFRLVDQILAMLHTGHFTPELRRRPVNLDHLLHAAIDDVAPFVELRKQTLTQAWPTDLGELNLEPERIRDGLNHLLLNAIKFTQDGGEINVAARRTQNGGAEIAVSDNGVGIDAGHLPHLFKPFFTGLNVTHHSSGRFEYGRKGIGLGLSVVKAFVELHGGTLAFAPNGERGTTFTISLPPS